MDKMDEALSKLTEGPQPGEHYRHFKKGTLYEVTLRSVDEATLEQLVSYKRADRPGSITRTLKNFTETIKSVPRFQFVNA